MTNLNLPHLVQVCEALKKARLGANTWEFSKAQARFELDCDESTVLSLLYRLMAAEERVKELESKPCPHVVTSQDGTAYCRLAEKGRPHDAE